MLIKQGVKMTDEMKLLRAFIEASGYEIETIEDIEHTYKREDMSNGAPKINAMPDSVSKKIDYRVTKRGKQ